MVPWVIFFCDEKEYVELIKNNIDAGELVNSQILVRPHLGYKNDVNRFSSLEGIPGVFVDKSDKQNYALRDNYDTSKDHVYNLFNSVYHADVCVNVASTLSLDAIACGTEVVNIYFDVESVSKFNGSAKQSYHDDYIRKLVSIDGTWLVKNKKDFCKTLKMILEDGKRKGKKQTIDAFIHKLDGMSAERITQALVKISN